MRKVSADVFSAANGEVVKITVTSVNFVNNADLDDELTPVNPNNNFVKSGQLTMGDEETTFTVAYNFPNPMPAGGKYTRTITGPGGFQDGPFDVLQPGDDPNVALPYIIQPEGGGLGSR